MIYVIKSDLPGKPSKEKPLPTGSHRTPPKGYPEKRSEYASPNEYKYPLDTEKHIRAAISYFSMPKNSAKYSPEERKAIWKRIVRAAKKAGIELSDEVLERAGLKKSIEEDKAHRAAIQALSDATGIDAEKIRAWAKKHDVDLASHIGKTQVRAIAEAIGKDRGLSAEGGMTGSTPAGHHWVTIRGAHVLIDGRGRVVSGAGGRLKDVKLKKSIIPVIPVVRVEKARKLHYRTDFQGLPISVENRKGSIRRWYDPHEDRNGETKMQHPYGYIRLSEGKDGDHIDCYVGPNKDSRMVAVIRQQNPINETYDEDKVMLGFNMPSEAKKAYLAHYDNPDFFGGMDVVDIDEFKRALKENHEGAGGRLRLKIKKSIGYSKAGKAHLVPKRIAVTREGRTYQTTVWVKPGAEVADKKGAAPKYTGDWNNDGALLEYMNLYQGREISVGEKTYKVGDTVTVIGDPEVGIPTWRGQIVAQSGKNTLIVYDLEDDSMEEVPSHEIERARKSITKGCASAKDEAAWDRATAQVHKEYPELSEDDDRFWKIVQKIYDDMAGS